MDMNKYDPGMGAAGAGLFGVLIVVVLILGGIAVATDRRSGGHGCMLAVVGLVGGVFGAGWVVAGSVVIAHDGNGWIPLVVGVVILVAVVAGIVVLTRMPTPGTGTAGDTPRTKDHLVTCPACRMVTAVDSRRCQWCDQLLGDE